MKYNKEALGNAGLIVLQLVIITLWVISTAMVFSSRMQRYFDVNNTSMWAFGAVFGIFYIPMTRFVFEKIEAVLNNRNKDGSL